MAEPELLVDEADELQHLGPAPLGHLQVEGAGDMDRLDLGEPGDRDVIIRPAAGDGDGEFVVAVAVEGPVVESGKAFDRSRGLEGRSSSASRSRSIMP
jgi:hypothetical protein